MIETLDFSSELTPVIIPAGNEEGTIQGCLDSLDRTRLFPMVIVNGSDDLTAEIASANGAFVIDDSEYDDAARIDGKFPAILAGVRALGDRALDPLLILDADSRPLSSSRWVDTMFKRTSESESPYMVGGPLFYIGDRISMKNKVHSYLDYQFLNERGKFPGVLEANMGFHLKEREALDVLLNDTTHVFPGEGKVIRERLTRADVGGIFLKSRSFLSTVLTLDRNVPDDPLSLRDPKVVKEVYGSRKPDSAMSLDQWYRMIYRRHHPDFM